MHERENPRKIVANSTRVFAGLPYKGAEVLPPLNPLKQQARDQTYLFYNNPMASYYNFHLIHRKDYGMFVIFIEKIPYCGLRCIQRLPNLLIASGHAILRNVACLFVYITAKSRALSIKVILIRRDLDLKLP